MEPYEIRIMEPGHRDFFIYGNYRNSWQAICVGWKYAGGRRFEVWKDLDCVFSTEYPVQPRQVA